MNTYEKQLQSAAEKDILVIESYDMGNDPDHAPIEGLYLDGCVALSSDLQTTAQKNTILAEELAHHDLTVGDILDQRDAGNRRQEQKARTLAYDRLIGLQGLDRAIKHGCKNRYEAAEYLEVTEEFLQDAIDRYQEIYGPRYTEFINAHLKPRIKDITPEPAPAAPEPAADVLSPQPKSSSTLTPEEIQRRIERIRKRKKKLEAAMKKRDKRVKELERRGYDFFKAEEDRRLDPDWHPDLW